MCDMYMQYISHACMKYLLYLEQRRARATKQYLKYTYSRGVSLYRTLLLTL